MQEETIPGPLSENQRQMPPAQAGGTPGIWEIWTRLKQYGLIRRAGRCAAHICGIWNGPDLIALGRKMSAARGLRRLLLQIRYERLCLRLNVEIPNFDNIGESFVLAHPFAIVVNPAAVIGKHCTIYKGVTIGSIRNGRRMGVPVLEDRVVVHTNAVVAGGITIGHDSLIAAGAFVDFDVPPHSVVIGNPGVIHHKENASRDYII